MKRLIILAVVICVFAVGCGSSGSARLSNAGVDSTTTTTWYLSGLVESLQNYSDEMENIIDDLYKEWEDSHYDEWGRRITFEEMMANVERWGTEQEEYEQYSDYISQLVDPLEWYYYDFDPGGREWLSDWKEPVLPTEVYTVTVPNSPPEGRCTAYLPAFGYKPPTGPSLTPGPEYLWEYCAIDGLMDWQGPYFFSHYLYRTYREPSWSYETVAEAEDVIAHIWEHVYVEGMNPNPPTLQVESVAYRGKSIEGISVDDWMSAQDALFLDRCGDVFAACYVGGEHAIYMRGSSTKHDGAIVTTVLHEVAHALVAGSPHYQECHNAGILDCTHADYDIFRCTLEYLNEAYGGWPRAGMCGNTVDLDH